MSHEDHMRLQMSHESTSTLVVGCGWGGVSWADEEKRLSSSLPKPNPELSPKTAALCVCEREMGRGKKREGETRVL